ncbi:MAG TPA: UDP-N-acetylmuramoyl-L-alanyl-D-glutamate--2,6-diaminopimelate ligase [Thermohalobaculum sp.]|nr:UDP-N-acetylmuramoyl-L-alanyl-D-glutamate--2,6-diaminopimelate ligase [Thermohalobaculum sp.]
MTEPRASSLADLGLATLQAAGPAPDPATRVRGLAVDSRAVREGFVFFAIPGTRLDGARFAQYAVRQGAVAVVATRAGVETARADIGGLPVPFLVSDNPRRVLALAAARFFAAQPEIIAAVTGTNGKTSTAHFLRQIWEAAGHPAAAFGTTGVEGEGFAEPLRHTTPEPIALHALLARLAARGCTHAAMEASSHGLAQHRLDGVRLRAAGLTNITRDHMDYHADHEAYVAAKLRLFTELLPADGAAVLNAGDPAFPRAREAAAARNLRVIAVGRAAGADLRILDARFHAEGQAVTFGWAGREHRARLRLIGGFQAENLALAAGLAIATGVAPATVFAALPGLSGVRGRMQRAARRANGAAVYVDYAHTPDALASAIDALRPHCAGRLVVVFGAGGERDPGKRPLMGAAVASRADVAIVTDDNPRSEDPAAIRRAILAACPEAHEIGDRAAAILAGVDALTAPGDCLLIAGKGHEQGQEVDGAMLPFDDVDQAQASVAALDGAAHAFGDRA